MITDYWQSEHAQGKYTQVMEIEAEQYYAELQEASDEDMDSYFYPSDDSSVCSFETYCFVLGDEFANTY
jgi:hypothetical protein